MAILVREQWVDCQVKRAALQVITGPVWLCSGQKPGCFPLKKRRQKMDSAAGNPVSLLVIKKECGSVQISDPPFNPITGVDADAQRFNLRLTQ